MKKTTYFFALLLAALCLVSSCENEELEGEFFSTPDGSDPEDFCTDAPLAISNAQIALSNAAPAQQAALCDDLIETLNTTIDLCGDETGLFQALLDQLGTDCMVNTDDDTDDTDDSDGGDEMNLVGSTYLLTAFNLETPIDLNGDGSASTELISEGACYENETLFFDDETSLTVNSTSFLIISTEEQTDGSFTQTSECVFEDDVTVSNYIVDGSIITIDGIEGVITGTQIIFTVPEGFNGEVVGDEGMSSIEFLEDITFTYTLQ